MDRDVRRFVLCVLLVILLWLLARPVDSSRSVRGPAMIPTYTLTLQDMTPTITKTVAAQTTHEGPSGTEMVTQATQPPPSR